MNSCNSPEDHPADLIRQNCPQGRPIGFTSRREWRKYSHYSNRYVIGVGHGVSTVSQQESDDMALASAQQDAENRFMSLTSPIGGDLWPDLP